MSRWLVSLVFLSIVGAAQAQTVSSSTWSRFAEKDKRSRVFFIFGLEKDCSVTKGFNVRVERQPRNGGVELEKTNTTITQDWAFGNDNATREKVLRCIGRQVPVLSAFYRPRPGYGGFDDLLLVSTSSNGKSIKHWEIKISVR